MQKKRFSFLLYGGFVHAVVVVGMCLNPEQRNETTKTSKIRHFYRELTAISREFVSHLLSQIKISLHTNLQIN